MDHNDRLAGTLLGTALGDALGLVTEGLSPRAIARRFGTVDRFCLLGRTGFVSDDTEQSALVAQSLVAARGDLDRFEGAFGRSLMGWFARLPWGIGFATLRACLKRALGIRPSGVWSAGNGAAMRAAIVGTFFRDDRDRRLAFGRALAEVTHRDPRAVDGALLVAEVAAGCASAAPAVDRSDLVRDALQVATEPSLRAAVERALDLSSRRVPTAGAAQELGTTGFVIHTVGFAVHSFVMHGGEPLGALLAVINAGGDTDTIGAIVGAWLGALHGESRLPAERLSLIHDGPFGPTHLRALAAALADHAAGGSAPVPGYSAARAMLRNLLLCPVVLAHGVRRLVP